MKHKIYLLVIVVICIFNVTNSQESYSTHELQLNASTINQTNNTEFSNNQKYNFSSQDETNRLSDTNQAIAEYSAPENEDFHGSTNTTEAEPIIPMAQYPVTNFELCLGSLCSSTYP